MPVNWFKQYARVHKSDSEELKWWGHQCRQTAHRHKAFMIEVDTDKLRAYDVAKEVIAQGLIMDVTNWYDDVVILCLGSSRTAMNKLKEEDLC